MAQVPGCGCQTGGTTGSGGGTCASVVINDGFCTSAGAPVLVRTTILCNGTIATDAVYPDGTVYTGPTKACPIQCCEDVSSGGELLVPLGREQLTVGATVESLTPPAGAVVALVENIPPSAGDIRWTDSVSDPVGGGVSGFGHFLVPGATFEYRGDLSTFKMIRDGASDATVEISYYDVAP